MFYPTMGSSHPTVAGTCASSSQAGTEASLFFSTCVLLKQHEMIQGCLKIRYPPNLMVPKCSKHHCFYLPIKMAISGDIPYTPYASVCTLHLGSGRRGRPRPRACLALGCSGGLSCSTKLGWMAGSMAKDLGSNLLR
jgi:hypothetical protein